MSSCSPRIKQPSNAYIRANPVKPISINGLPVIPKLSTEFSAILKTGADTLGLAVNSKFVYFPFGVIKSKREPRFGVLKNFHIDNKIIKTNIGDIDIQVLTHAASKIILYFNTVNGGKTTELLKGEIYDADVSFINDIRIGMTIDDFYKCFFDKIPNELENSYKCFELTSLYGVKHVYSFEHGKLSSAKFSSIRAFDSDY